MFRLVIRVASQLDAWLHQRLGRPYAVALSAGLIVDIVHRVHDAPQHLESKHRLIGVALALLMEIGLLIHQLGELHERFEKDERTAGQQPSSDRGAAP